MTTSAWAGWAKIDTLLRSAGTSLSHPISDIRRGIPFSVTGNMIRYWYDGVGESPFGGDTLTQAQNGLKVTVGLFLPMKGAGTPTADAALDSLVEEADGAIQSALLGDSFLGTFGSGNSAYGVQIDETAASVEKVGDAVVRVLTVPVTYGIPDAYTIGA